MRVATKTATMRFWRIFKIVALSSRMLTGSLNAGGSLSEAEVAFASAMSSKITRN